MTGVDFVCLATSDLPAARGFYGRVLGLPCPSVWREADPVGAEYETGSLTLALLDSAALGIEHRPNDHPIALHVDDVAAARQELESRSQLMLHHRYAPRAPWPDAQDTADAARR